MSAELLSAIAAWLLLAGGLVKVYLTANDAEKRARRAEDRADEANELAEQANEQYERIANALDRLTIGATTPSGPAVEFILERRANDQYTLRNLGPEAATSVGVDGSQMTMHRELPDGINLRPMEGHTFVMIGSWGSPLGDQLEVSCDQLPEVAIVPIPSKR